jgi:MFS family permease
MGDSAAFSVMVGVGETYLPAFALAAGLGEVAAGLVSTVPLLMGSVLQLVAPLGVRWLQSHRRWIVLCVVCQATSFLPLAAAAAMGQVPGPLVFCAAAIYWGSGLASGPAWNTWMGGVVPQRVRSRYFARRTRLGHAGVLVGFAAAGLGLHFGADYAPILDVFAITFLAAAICRYISAAFLYHQNEADDPISEQRSVPLRELCKRLGRKTDGALLLYFLAVQCAVQISGPYFSPYMLRHLQLSYAQFVVLVAAAFVGRIVAMPMLGAFAGRYGVRALLWLGGIGIVPLSGAWLVSSDFTYLIGLQVTVGVLWGSYELAVALLFLEAIDIRERTSVLTKYNVAHAGCTAFGSLMAGAALTYFGKTPENYQMLFAVSTIARLAALVLLWRVPSGASTSETVSIRLEQSSPARERIAA